MSYTIYLAHPISGLSYDEVYEYYESTRSKLLGYGCTVLYPMTAKGYLRNEKKLAAGGYKFPPSTNHAIIERDNWMVTQADIVLLDLSGSTTVSIGCIMELAWAYQLRKHTVVVLEPDNIHRHAFVVEAADIIFETSSEALDYIERLVWGAW